MQIVKSKPSLNMSLILIAVMLEISHVQPVLQSCIHVHNQPVHSSPNM